jgi:hypothetical protein
VRRRLISLVALTAAVLPVAAFAGSVGTTSASLAGGQAAVVACDAAFGQSYTTVGGNVTAVTITGIADPACEQGQLSVTLTNAAGAALGAGGPVLVPSDGDIADNSVTVTIAAQPDGELVAGIRIAIAGP